MLKTHFPQSQFIVVSLKEGMFNNANVVFRCVPCVALPLEWPVCSCIFPRLRSCSTKFVDGVSAVIRTALAHNKGAAAAHKAKEAQKARDKENQQAAGKELVAAAGKEVLETKENKSN